MVVRIRVGRTVRGILRNMIMVWLMKIEITKEMNISRTMKYKGCNKSSLNEYQRVAKLIKTLIKST